MTDDEWTQNAGVIRTIAIDSHAERGPALASHSTPEMHTGALDNQNCRATFSTTY